MPMLEYVPKSHQYLANGRKIPSVTQIVTWKFDIYKDVPKAVLQRKAEYGNKAHKAVEDFIRGKLDPSTIEDEDIKRAVYDYKEIARSHCFYIKDMEKQIHYKNKYAGTYDLLTEDDVLIDLKTTAQIHVNNETKQAPLNLQLSLYKYAMKNVEECWYIWLPKGKKAKCERVELWTDEEVENLLEEYKIAHPNKK